METIAPTGGPLSLIYHYVNELLYRSLPHCYSSCPITFHLRLYHPVFPITSAKWHAQRGKLHLSQIGNWDPQLKARKALKASAKTLGYPRSPSLLPLPSVSVSATLLVVTSPLFRLGLSGLLLVQTVFIGSFASFPQLLSFRPDSCLSILVPSPT